MNIKRAKEEIKDTIEAYLLKDENGEYVIPSIRQRPVLLIGPPGVGKTQIMEQISRECRIGLISYTITHHTRQSAVGLPFIEKKTYGDREYAVTEYTMSEIVASIYDRMEETGLKEGILLLMKSTAYPRPWLRPCCNFSSARPSEAIRYRRAGLSQLPAIRRSITNL